MMAFCESQWFGGGGAASTASSASDVIWYGNGSTSTTSSYTGINCWMTGGSGGGGTCTTTEYVSFQQMQALQMQHQQSLMQMQMQMQAQQIFAAQSLHQCSTNQMSAEERQQQQARANELMLARREQILLQTEAGNRAKELLLEHLTPKQKQTFEKNKWFVVEGGRSKQQYRIMAERCSINIEVMDGKKVSHKLCAHLGHDIPLHDHILAQKIMLESAEDDFLKIANRHAA